MSIDTDDARLITDLLSEQWSLEDRPEIRYEPEAFIVDARNGLIYISSISQTARISSVDYASVSRTGTVSVRLSSRFREDHFRWRDEIWRILLANRRLGRRDGRLGNYTYLEVPRNNSMNDLSGWYVTTFEIRMTGYFVPLESTGLDSV